MGSSSVLGSSAALAGRAKYLSPRSNVTRESIFVRFAAASERGQALLLIGALRPDLVLDPDSISRALKAQALKARFVRTVRLGDCSVCCFELETAPFCNARRGSIESAISLAAFSVRQTLLTG